MPYLILEKKEVYFREAGRASGRGPVVFIHGAGGSSNIWLRQLPALEEDFYVLALDLPGHGNSEGEGEGRVEGYGRVLLSFLEVLGLAEACLVGHSMGGAIAMTVALSHPQRVKKMVLAGSGAQLQVPPEVYSALKKDLKEAIRIICRYAYSPRFPTYLLSLGEAEIGKCGPEVILRDFATCDAFDIRLRLSEISPETLILCGRDDRFTPLKLSEYLQSQLPHCRMEIMEKAGHMAMIEDAPAFNAALLRFLE
jgi:pimeloyl-ACP methyl ester carboxylesterase